MVSPSFETLTERLEKDLAFRERERAAGYTLEGLHNLYRLLSDRVLELERFVGYRGPPPKAPSILHDEDRIPELDAEGLGAYARRRSERAAAISMSAPGLHARFRGRAPTRFAMAFLVSAVVVAGMVGYALRPVLGNSTPEHQEKGSPP
jgi:hypothetical protein